MLPLPPAYSKLAPFPLSPHPIRSNLILWYFFPPQFPQWACTFQTKILSIVRGSINGKTRVGQQLIGRSQIEPSRCICSIWSVVRRGQGEHSFCIGREIMKMTGPRHRNRSCNICDTIHGIHVVQWFVGSTWGWLTAIVPCLKSVLQHGISSIPKCIGKGHQVQTIKQSLSHHSKPMAFVCTGLTYCRAHFNKKIVVKVKITKKKHTRSISFGSVVRLNWKQEATHPSVYLPSLVGKETGKHFVKNVARDRNTTLEIVHINSSTNKRSLGIA